MLEYSVEDYTIDSNDELIGTRDIKNEFEAPSVRGSSEIQEGAPTIHLFTTG